MKIPTEHSSLQKREAEPGKDGGPESQMGNSDRTLPSLLEGEHWFKHLPHQLVGAAVAPLALLRWAQIRVGSCYTLLFEV